MFHNLSLEKQAYCLARMVYRDTEIEDYHHAGAALGPEIYGEMLRTVRQNLGKVRRHHRRMLSIQTAAEAEALLRRMQPSERQSFIAYVRHFEFLARFHCDWDPPRQLELPAPPADLAGFILGGHFLAGCESRRVLTDPVMCWINKDIYNRIYTLACRRFLP